MFNIGRTSKKKQIKKESSGPDKTRLPLFFRLTLQEQMLFTKRLALLLKAGVPIMDSLSMMQKQATSRSLNHVLTDLASGVEGGQYLHTRMDKYRKHFGDFVVNIVKVGEVSGTLDENLEYLAEELKKRRELRRKVISSLIYPAVIIVATIAISILLTVYIFPKVLPILQGFKGELPFTTRTLIFVSHLLITRGLLIGGIVAALVILFVVLSRSQTFRYQMDRMFLRIPILGRLFQFYYMSNFCRTLGILLKSDVRIVEAATITANTTTNLVYRNSLLELAEGVSRGEKISVHLVKNAHLFPEMVGQMIHVGENTGKLSDTLLYLAEIYEEEVDELTQNLSTSIEPVLMVFMGLLVGFIALSIITPIYSLTQNLSVR